MIRHTKAFAAVLAVSTLALSACGSSSSGSGDPSKAGASLTTIKFAGPSAPNGIVAQMAYGEKEGIFAKYGINLEIEYPTSGSSTVGQLLANGTYQLTEMPASTILADYQEGVKLVSPMGFIQKNALGITLRKDEGITSPQQLVGKTIGYPTGTPEDKVLDTYLQMNGVDPSKVKTIALSLAALASALIGNKIDGIDAYPYAYDPNINSQNVATNDLLFTPQISTMTAAFAVSADWAAANKAIMPKLVKAIQASTEGAIKHPAVAAKDLVATAPGSAPAVSAVQAQWEGTEPYLSTSADQGKPLGWMSTADWASTMAFAKKYLGLKDMDPSAVYTNAYVGN